MNACTWVPEEAGKVKQCIIGSHFVQRSCEISMLEVTKLKPKLLLRHKDAEEARNVASHQGNLQVPNGVDLKERECVLQKARP